MPTSRSRIAGLAATALASAALLSGCSGDATSQTGTAQSDTDSDAPPAEELQSAFTQLGEANTLATTLTLDVPEEAQEKVKEENPEAPAAVLNLLNSGHAEFVLSAPEGKKLSDLDGKQAPVTQFAFSDGSADLVSLIADGDSGYLRIDLPTIEELTGEQLAAPMMSMSAFLPGSEEVLTALNEGNWVSVQMATMNELDAETTPTDPALARDLSTLVWEELTAAGEVSETAADTEYTLIVPVKEVAENVVAGLEELSAEHPEVEVPEDARQLGDVPEDMEAEMVVSVDDGAASEVRVDLAQFLSEAEKEEAGLSDAELNLTVGFDTGAEPVAVPTDAVPADELLTALISGFA